VASVFLFAVNLGATVLLPERGAKGEPLHGEAVPASPAPAGPEIGPDTRVGEVLTRWPWTLDVFVASGFGGLADPAHREQVKQMPITASMACQRHGVEVGPIVEKLRVAAGRAGTATRADQVLGEVLAAHPQTEPVFRRYYGSGCFSCPGQATETVKQSAVIHNVDLEQLLEELNRAAG